MSLRFVIEPDCRLVVMTAQGTVSTQDLMDFFARVRVDPLFRPDLDQISDFRSATPSDITANQVDMLIGGSPFAISSRRAYVVAPGISFGMARMTAAIAEGRHLVTRIFEDVESARAWLAQGRP